MTRSLALFILAGLAASSCPGLEIDPPARPNEDCYVLREKLETREMPIERRVEYFKHYNPIIRRLASFSLMRDGQKAMPYIIKALQSADLHVVRAGCDALAGPFAIAPRGRRELLAAMTPDIAGKAAPHLAKLLDHEDMYVREGALLALSNCGKHAAPHLDKVVKFLDDEEWWLRSAASHVLKNVGPPEADASAEKMARAFVKEPSVYAKLRMRDATARLFEDGSKQDEIIKIVARDIEARGRGYYRSCVLDMLPKLGAKARSILPTIDKLLKREEDRLAGEKDPKERAATEREIAYLKKLRAGLAAPGRKKGR